MKKRFLVAVLAAVMAVGAVALTACGDDKYAETDLSKALAVYNSIQDYSVSGNETTIKSKVKLAQDKDAYMEVTAVVAPHATAGEGSAADSNAAFKTITVSITGADKSAYETALAATESDIEYNNPKKLEGKAIRIMQTGAAIEDASSEEGAYQFVTAASDADINAVGTAAAKAMEQIVGYYRYTVQLKDAFGGFELKANKIDVSTTYETEVELINIRQNSNNATTTPSVEVTDIWELEDSYIIVADSKASNFGQNIVVMLQIGKSDNKIKNAIAPYIHVSEYHSTNSIEGNEFVYISALRANLAALAGKDTSAAPFAAKGEEGSIANITTSATLTTNVVTNAVNIIVDYYLNVIKG